MDYTRLEDKDIREWSRMAMCRGGDFVKAMGEAALRADDSNFAIIRAAMLSLIAKYPKYLEWAREEKSNG